MPDVTVSPELLQLDMFCVLNRFDPPVGAGKRAAVQDWAVAAAPKAAPLVLVQIIAFDPLVVQSPLSSDAAGVVPSRKMPVPALVLFNPPFARGRFPVTPVPSGNPVAFARVPLDGVPRAPPEYKRVCEAGTFVPLTLVELESAAGRSAAAIARKDGAPADPLGAE